MYLTQFYPTPRSYMENDGSYSFGARVIMRLSFTPSAIVLAHLTDLWHRFTCGCSTLTFVHEIGIGFSAQIGDTAAKTDPPADSPTGDTYRIDVVPTGVTLRGGSEKALLDGFMLLLQCIEPRCLTEGAESFVIPAMVVEDGPQVAFRAIHLCVFPESERHTLEKAIHLAGFLHLTHVVLEFWGTYPYRALSSLHWHGGKWSRGDAEALVRLARGYGMEVIPMINHFGHAASARSCYGRHVVLDADLRQSLLFEPDGWTWCSSNPDTYRLLSEMRAEMAELCGDGSYFHLGFDEAYSFATCPTCRRRVPHELLAEYANRLTEELAASGRRPILWHDMFLRHDDFKNEIGTGDYLVANGAHRDTASALPLLDRRILLADWQYGYFSGKNPTMPYLRSLGFDVLLSPWDDLRNIRSLAANARDTEGVGVLLTTWHHLPAYLQKLFFAAEYLWQNKPISDQITERACLLRRLYDAEGDYRRAGWNAFEVEG